MKKIGIYHSADLDGLASAGVMLAKMPNIELYGWDYGDPIGPILLEIAKMEGDVEVYMSDISFPEDNMVWLDTNSDFHWIDHHKTAIDLLKKYNFKGYRVIGTGACKLLEDYLMMKNNPTIELLAQYDVWNKYGNYNWELQVLPFQYAARLWENPIVKIANSYSPHNKTKIDISNEISAGQKILKYDRYLAKEIGVYAYDLVFEGFNFIALNTNNRGSSCLEHLYDESKHDGMLVWRTNGREITASMYGTKDEIDLSKIAQKYGGGGHKHACGFRMNLSQIELLLSCQGHE